MYRVAIILTLLLGASTTQAQDWRGSLVFGDKTVTLYPLATAFDPSFYPVAQLAVEYHYIKKEKFSLFQTALLHGHYHQFLGTGLGVRTEVGLRFRLYKGLYGEALLGVGYLASIPSKAQFELNSAGEYEQTRPILSTMEVPISLGIGYQFKSRWSIFLRYQYSVQFPYGSTIPVVPSDHVFLGLGFPLSKSS